MISGASVQGMAAVSAILLTVAGLAAGAVFSYPQAVQMDAGWARLQKAVPGGDYSPVAQAGLTGTGEPQWITLDCEVRAEESGERSVYLVRIESVESDYWFMQQRAFRPSDLKNGRFAAAFAVPGMNLSLRLSVGIQGTGDLSVRNLTVRRIRAELPSGKTAPVSAQDLPFSPVGLCQHMERTGEHLWFKDDSAIDRGLDLMKEAGVQWVRVGAGFGSVFPRAEGVADREFIRRLDQVCDGAIKRGMQVYVKIVGTAKWSAVSGDFKPWWGAPAQMDPWCDYVRFVADHFSGRVRYFEVGNEPDWHFFLGTAEQFAEQFIAAAKILRKRIPDVRIIGPGLAGDGVNMGFVEDAAEPFYLQKLFDAGIWTYLDILSMHVYEEDLFASVDKVNRFCDVLDANGLADRPVWVAEAGYSYSSHKRPGFRERQAVFLRDLFSVLPQHPRVEKVFWWHLGGYPHAEPQVESGRDLVFLASLINCNLVPEPAYEALKDLKKGEERTLIPELRELNPGRLK